MLCLGIFLKLDEIEIVTAIFGRGGFRERAGRRDEHRESGRQANAFCVPASSTSMPSWSKFSGTAVMELTASTMNITSGYFFLSAAISASGDITPVEVSLWIERERVELAGRELFVNRLRADGRTPVHLQRVRLLAAFFGKHPATCRRTRRTCSSKLFCEPSFGSRLP